MENEVCASGAGADLEAIEKRLHSGCCDGKQLYRDAVALLGYIRALQPRPTVEAGAIAVDLAKLKEFAEAATPGPWLAESELDEHDQGYAIIACNSSTEMSNPTRGMVAFATQRFESLACRANAVFIAALNPQVVLDLISAAEERDRLREALLPLAKQADFYQPEIPFFESVLVPLQFLRHARQMFAGELPPIEEIMERNNA